MASPAAFDVYVSPILVAVPENQPASKFAAFKIIPFNFHRQSLIRLLSLCRPSHLGVLGRVRTNTLASGYHVVPSILGKASWNDINLLDQSATTSATISFTYNLPSLLATF